MEQKLLFGNQKTIKHEISCFGVGLHNGKIVNMKLKPAPVDSGIVFIKLDEVGNVVGNLKALYSNVCNTQFCTSLGSEDNKIKIATIEHLMAALWGCGIDNIFIEIDNEEVPIMDGSSEHFVFMIECAGIDEQNKGRSFIEVLKDVSVEEAHSVATLTPAKNFTISLEIEFAHQVVSKQKFMFDSSYSSFKLDLCRARTFGFVSELDKLKSMGLAQGASLENVIGIGEDKILNESGLRFDNEFVRHKVLDSIGDLYLAGTRLLGDFSGVKSGHGINNKLLRKLFADPEAWRLVEMPYSS